MQPGQSSHVPPALQDLSPSQRQRRTSGDFSPAQRRTSVGSAHRRTSVGSLSNIRRIDVSALDLQPVEGDTQLAVAVPARGNRGGRLDKGEELGRAHGAMARLNRADTLAAIQKDGFRKDSVTSLQGLVGDLYTRMKDLKRLPADIGVVKCSLCAFVFFMIAWGVLASILLVVLSSHYITTATDAERERYAVDGCMAHMHAEVQAVLLPAYQVQAALRRAVRSGLVTGASSVSVLELLLAPVLRSSAHLSGVQLAFPGASSTTTLVISRTRLADGSDRTTIQSDGASCYVLGPGGCVDPAAGGSQDCFLLGAAGCQDQSGTVPWISEGLALQDAVMLPGESGLFVSQWSAAPELEVLAGALAPVCRLLFRTSERLPNGQELTVVGRVSVEIGGLTGAVLDDDQLGPEGKVYLVDAAHRVLASRSPADVVAPDGLATGGLAFRAVAEVEALQPVAPDLAAAVPGAGATVRDPGGGLAVLRWLPSPLSSFAVVVYAPERGPFIHMPMMVTCFASTGVAVLPYVIIVFGFVFIILADCVFILRQSKEENVEGNEPEM